MEKSIAAYNEVKFSQHEYRLGIFTGVGLFTNQTPFSGMISQVEKETGIEIEFVLMDNWEEVRTDIEKIAMTVLRRSSYLIIPMMRVCCRRLLRAITSIWKKLWRMWAFMMKNCIIRL